MNRVTVALLVALAGCALAGAQALPDRAITGWCNTGSTKANTSGIPSNNMLQGVIPNCAVTVFLTGSTTKATIHRDAFGTALSNPFTATNIGQWTFYAAPAVGYDIVLSGGTPPNSYPQPVTLPAIMVGGGSAGTPPGGNPNELQVNINGFFEGTTGMTWDATTNTLLAPNVSATTATATTLNANAATVGNLNVTGTSNINIPPAQVTWPPTCTTGVYSPASNSCVAPGTAANPAGSSGEAQINQGGIFSSISGSAPLGTNGMQYQGDVKANNLIGTTAISTPAAIGYRQNTGNPGRPPTAITHNRDQITAVFAMPQDFCPNAGSGPPNDDTPCFNRAIRWLASQNNNASKTLYVPWTPNGYYFSNEGAQFQYILPYDFGDYHGSAASLTPASASVYFTNGKLTSCAIQGGTGYAPNAQLPIQILDPQHLGSGAAAYVLTDASGTPASTCVVQLAGMNYPQVGINTNVIPLGGDGAAGTCALAGGTFTSPCTLTAGGSGYNPASKPQANMAGLTCTTYPALTLTITGTSMTAVTTTAGANCTFAGLSTNTVPIQFGASCGGTQCTILPMETPVALPLSVALLSGVQIVGIGNPVINTSYSLTTATSPSFTDAIAFGDPWGDQTAATRVDITGDMKVTQAIGPSVTNVTVNAQIEFAFPLLAGGTFDRITCGRGICFYIGNTQTSLLGTVRAGSTFTNIQLNNLVTGWFVGGNWTTRSPDTFAGGNFGGTFMTHNPAQSGGDMVAFGQIGGITIDNVFAAFSNQTAIDTTWDVWAEQYLWKAQNSPAVPKTDANHMLSNTSTTCPLGGSLTFATRATDDGFGYVGTYNAYSWFQCFRGIGGSLVSGQSRYSTGGSFMNFFPSQLGFNNYTFNMRRVRVNFGWRPLFIGNAVKVDLSDFVTLSNFATTDPYLPGGVTNAWVSLVNYSAPQGSIADINTGTGTTGLRTTYYGIATGSTPVASLYLRNISGVTDYSKGMVYAAALTTTASTTDNVTVTGMTSIGRCQLMPTNASAATNIITTYVSAKTTNQITVTHTATAGMTYDVSCTAF